MPKKRGGGGPVRSKAAGIPAGVMKKAGKALGAAPAMKKATTATAVKALGRRSTTPTKKAVKAIRTTRKKGY